MNKIYQDCWEHFKRSGSNQDLAICKICLKSLSCKGSATIGLRRHLEGVHEYKREENNDGTSTSRNAKRYRCGDNQIMESYLKRPTMAELISKLAAVDGISFNRITKSEFIRSSMSSKGFNLPQNSTKVMQLMLNFYEDIKQQLIKKINQHKDSGKKFSISIDEWTSMKNKRYMDLQLYYDNKDSDNLGMVPVVGSCPAEKILELVKEKLKSFNIIFNEDIVSTMSDGAAVMQKFGRLSSQFHQLCYNHGLHLAVMKVFYIEKGHAENVSSTEDLKSDNESEIEYSENENNNSNDSDIEVVEVCNVHLQPQFKKAIKYIRQISKMFKNSPIKNTILQKYVMEEEKKELMVILDCCTRWNTMEAMVERFLRISGPIKKTLLRELNLGNLWNDNYVEIAKIILATLKPLRITIENLSRADSTLLTAEGALKFLFTTLEKLNTNLSQDLLNAVREEMSKRRDNTIVSLIRLLQNPGCMSITENDSFFDMASKKEIYKLAKTISCRIFVANNSNYAEETGEINSLEEYSTKELSLQQQLNFSIMESLKEIESPNADKFQTLVKELKIFEANGIRSSNLQNLLDALLTIKPTSTQNERNFSTATDFVTKKRTKMGNSTLDALCFLKHHFKSKK